MTAGEIRKRFLDFMERNGHAVVPSSSLVPSDPSVLLTTAGMQQFKPYYTGEADAQKDFGGQSTASVQKSFRTSDIDEVGDETHLTFFEMLGNFSFGGYKKEKAIELGYKFIKEEMGLKISYVTVFEGKADIGVPKDEESKAIWKSLDAQIDVREEGMADVFWGPTGSSGPCGPTTEIYCRNAAGQDVEIWNIVFNQYFYPGSREELNSGAAGKKLEPLPVFGVDTGMGLERLAMISEGKKNIFETDLFAPLIECLPEGIPLRAQRVVADHFRGSAFLLADGVRPSNKERGYVLRRLMRRMMVYQYLYKIGTDSMIKFFARLIADYGGFYAELSREEAAVRDEFIKEGEKFGKTIAKGIKELEAARSRGAIDGQGAFLIYETFGLPYEIIKELGGAEAEGLTRESFDAEFKKHQEISKAGQEKKFGGHGLLLDTGELKAGNEEELKIVTRLHTATHMLQRALREVLGSEVHQAGSDITAERTRFDFTFSRKLTPEEIKKVEDLINEKIKEDLPMQKVVLPKAEAEKTGALYFFKEKYPDPVNVYFIGRDIASAWSKEFCGGPHVAHTGEIGKVKIAKEEAVGAGVRRIRAVVE